LDFGVVFDGVLLELVMSMNSLMVVLSKRLMLCDILIGMWQFIEID
jgi:hypothetical protein